jgi:heavy metal translocating P-type ATPase
MRLRLRWLGDPEVDLTEVRARIAAVAGVESLRLSPRAHSLAVVYAAPAGGGTATRAALLHAVAELDPGALRGLGADPNERGDASATTLLIAALTVVALPFLPMRLRQLVVLASVAPTLARGAEALVTRGVSVEVLDAVAVAVPALRGRTGTAATTGLLLSFAEYVEERASQRSDDLVRSLLRATPETAWIRDDGGERQIPYAELSVGDRVVVGPGATIPVDGVVADGGGTLDRSAITGESIPVPVEPGAAVTSGATLIDGRLVVAAERVGDATTTARIARFIEKTLTSRSRLQGLADRMADRRVWITFGTAGAVYALTGSLGRVETISLVDFSCTTKLGTAVSIKAALYRAGQMGLLVKGGDALEALAKADTIVFDKTGTLTTGRLQVAEVLPFQPDAWPPDRLLALAGSLAEHTSHPVASSLTELMHARELAHIGHAEVDFMVGHGLSSTVDGARIAIGSRHYLTEHETVDFDAWAGRLDALTQAGDSLLYLSRDGAPLGAIALRDQLRPEAAEVLQRLRALGVKRLVMISGDRRETAQRLGRELRLDGVYAEAQPEEKADIVQRLRQGGHRVAFVGDGVNDGPALMAADVGIAMPRAAELARATADVVLLDDQLARLADARALSGATLTHLHRVLNGAAAVNTAVLAGAALGRLAPLPAAVLHNGTTLAVLAASWFGIRKLRPKRSRPDYARAFTA